MDTMASLMATAMETVVTGIVVIEVQDVIGDKVESHGEGLLLVEAFPVQQRHSFPYHPNLIGQSVPALLH